VRHSDRRQTFVQHRIHEGTPYFVTKRVGGRRQVPLGHAGMTDIKVSF
jgi:hypothetical protein